LKNLKIFNVEINDEIPHESAIIFYHLLEKILLDTLPDYPLCKGFFLSETFKEFKEPLDLKVRKKDANYHKKNS
jgi:hypothetical protein